ncbi:LOW QUALITY PROTEIN: regulator of G-protein signaling protein-like [Lutra lutra]|uniref:LOW QUALITY PROTEIN: regulator of G-protein signaling protein-like n=1 Tax=Lutra lutra TaxID=9657 RepID=UPI001FD5EF26|nr:LOW QUALITY PROTEIN: regulator of G-protein signaling protein-like [Lutra lutra]
MNTGRTQATPSLESLLGSVSVAGFPVSNTDFSTTPNAPGRPTANTANVRNADLENGDVILMKRRILGHRIITVNFAINDLYFFSEIERFNDLVSSAHVLQADRAYKENDVALMRSKINIILKLYLHSEIPPRLRVNISESQKDAIIAAIAEGHLDRNIFHGTVMSLFPIIMYFWKRFCSWKATHSYFQFKGKTHKDKKTSPKPTHKTSPWSGGDHAILRFTLLRGIEWFRPQQREVIASPGQNSPANLNRTSIPCLLLPGSTCYRSSYPSNKHSCPSHPYLSHAISFFSPIFSLKELSPLPSIKVALGLASKPGIREVDALLALHSHLRNESIFHFSSGGGLTWQGYHLVCSRLHYILKPEKNQNRIARWSHPLGYQR